MTLEIIPATNSTSVFKKLPDDCWHIILEFSNMEDLLKITRVCQFLRFWGQNELHRYIFPDIQALNLRKITVLKFKILKITEDQMKTFYRRIPSEDQFDMEVIRLKQEQLSIAFELLNQMHEKQILFILNLLDNKNNLPIIHKINFLRRKHNVQLTLYYDTRTIIISVLSLLLFLTISFFYS